MPATDAGQRRTVHQRSLKPEDRARYLTGEPPCESQLLDVRAVAELLCCSSRHIHRLLEERRMPQGLKVGALRRFRRSEIENWIAAGCPAGDAK